MGFMLPPKFEAALRDVRAQRPESRIAAAERLGRAEGNERERALDGLLALSTDTHPSVRATALAGLGVLAEPRGLDAALARIDDASPEVRELAIIAAAQIGGPRAVAALHAALESNAPEVRFQAIAGIADLDPDGAASALVPLLGDGDAEVRAQALLALSSLGEHHLSGHIAGALDDPSHEVRLEAALALARLGDKRGEGLLIAALGARVRVHEVIDALGRLGATHARDALAKIALSFLRAPDVRAAAAAALVRLGDPRGVPALRRVLRGLRSDARSYAVELAGEIMAEELVPDLAHLVSRPRGTDPFTLVAALGRFRGRSPDARRALERLAALGGDVGAAASRALAGE